MDAFDVRRILCRKNFYKFQKKYDCQDWQYVGLSSSGEEVKLRRSVLKYPYAFLDTHSDSPRKAIRYSKSLKPKNSREVVIVIEY